MAQAMSTAEPVTNPETANVAQTIQEADSVLPHTVIDQVYKMTLEGERRVWTRNGRSTRVSVPSHVFQALVTDAGICRACHTHWQMCDCDHGVNSVYASFAGEHTLRASTEAGTVDEIIDKESRLAQASYTVI